MFQGGCAPAIMRCAVAARAKRLKGKSVVERPGGCLGHPGPVRAGGRCGTLVLTEGWRSTRRPGPQGTSPFSSFGWRLLQKMSAKKSIESCSRLGIKASSPCGQKIRAHRRHSETRKAHSEHGATLNTDIPSTVATSRRYDVAHRCSLPCSCSCLRFFFVHADRSP